MIVMAVWRNLGTVMIIMLAGLQSVPQSLMEAAELDGAGAWHGSGGSPSRCCVRPCC